MLFQYNPIDSKQVALFFTSLSSSDVVMETKSSLRAKHMHGVHFFFLFFLSLLLLNSQILHVWLSGMLWISLFLHGSAHYCFQFPKEKDDFGNIWFFSIERVFRNIKKNVTILNRKMVSFFIRTLLRYHISFQEKTL